MGEVRTYVHSGEKFDVDEWFRNLKAGHTFVSNGPALELTVDGALPGTELKRASGSRLKIQAKALGHTKIGLPTVLRVEGSTGVLKEVKSARGESELSFELDHAIDASQWLMASTTCENGALAHTTPVYVVVNGQPTWNRQSGPKIIDKQLAAIAKIEAEFSKSDDARKAGIRERLQKAKAFYANLREKMAG
jgi:hypothetical protein